MKIWNELFDKVMREPKMNTLKNFIQAERKSGKNIYPSGADVFRAYNLCPYESVRVVILGTEPYCTSGAADGLAFSTQQNERPEMLQIIFKEIYKDLNIQYFHGDDFEEFFPTNNLEKWAQNGFLLLNTCLTVEEGMPNSHKGKGWEYLIEETIKALNERNNQIVFLLWGDNAKQYKPLIKSPHIAFDSPAPLNEEFYGHHHFSILRDILPAAKGYPSMLNATHKFDKEAVKKYVKEKGYRHADEICDYVDNRLMINIPVNPDEYSKQLKDFENLMSTKYDNNNE